MMRGTSCSSNMAPAVAHARDHGDPPLGAGPAAEIGCV
jgi:hypothetical protein